MSDNPLLDFARSLNTLYRARPYTKAFPFLITFSGVAGESHPVWVPQGAYFECAGGIIKSTILAGVDYNLADSRVEQIFGMVIAKSTEYSPIDVRFGTYRSIDFQNPQALLVDTNGVAAIVKGVIYGWEVTRDGWYR